MSLLILVHLTEVSQPFRTVQLRLLPFDPPFEGESVAIPIQISNPIDLRLEKIRIRLGDKAEWIETGPVPGKSTTVALLPHEFNNGGPQLLPALTVRNVPPPKLFRFWRVINFEEVTFVLPRPINHHVLAKPHSHLNHDDHELVDIERIRDPRLLPFTDQKLFLKTGIPYRRLHRSNGAGEQVELSWTKLAGLGPREQNEQFSYWIKSFSDERGINLRISVKAPFIVDSKPSRSMNWRNLKILFAKWIYVQS